MTSGIWLRRLSAIIALITIATGLTQIVAPGFLLAMMDTESSPASRQLLGIVGMFMALFGGALLHAIFATRPQPIVSLYAALQKVGAVLGVGIGVIHAIFAPLALIVAAFDLISAIIILALWREMRLGT